MIPGSRFGNVILAPVSVVLSRVLVQIFDTVSAAKDVLVERECFSELARYLQKMQPVLVELQEKNLLDTPPLRASLDALELEMKKAQELIADCSSKSRFYLLINCRGIVKQVQDITHEIGRCLSMVPMAAMNLSAETRTSAQVLFEDMKRAEFRAALAGEEVVGMIENGVRAHRQDSEFSNELLLQIANAVNVPINSDSLREELIRFKKEKEEIELHKDQAEAYQLEQIIGILSRADAATTRGEKELIYRRKKSAGGNQPLSALQSFICPITREVMEDPVEVSSGQTYERSAILQWFASGKNTCPATKMELESLEVKPNPALRQSIEEWKERNTIISIGATRLQLLSGNQEEVQKALLELHRLSEEKPLHKYWIASEHLIPEIVKQLGIGQRDVRKRCLSTLCSLAQNDENKEEIAAAGGIPVSVRSLARDVGESRQAVALLLELSRLSKLLDDIGKAKGCILLLVTMLRSGDSGAVEDARQLLVNLSDSDENVIQMAEANHFPPLITRLREGSEETKVAMATAMSKMSLTDESKAVLAKEGAIEPLVQMLASVKHDHQNSVLGALQALSTIPEAREALVLADIFPRLLQLLFSLTSAVCSQKEMAAATLANLASCETEAVDKFDALQHEEIIYQLVALMKMTGPSVQVHLLRGMIAMCSKGNGFLFRQRLRRAEAFHTLIQFFQESGDMEVRKNSLKLLFWISKDDSGRQLGTHITGCIPALVKFISSTQDDDANSAALSVISNLPQANAEVLKLLLQAEALPTIAKLLSAALNRISPKPALNSLLENSIGALLLFSNPSSVETQSQAAGCDVIPLSVKLLGVGTPRAKSRAAALLGQFSENSGRLSTPISPSGACLCFLSSSSDSGCPVHGGRCSVRSSFCLVEAGAVGPLVQTLEDADGSVQEAALGALATLLYDDTWKDGVHVIAKAQGVRPVVRVLMMGSTGAKEKAVWMLERIFRFEMYKEEYGGAAQMPLIDLTQNGGTSTRQLAAKVLAHLHVLHNQSSYF